MLFPAGNIVTTTINDQLFEEKGVSLSILRTDQLHEVISGNKLFKIKPFIDEALNGSFQGLATFGGPYSNHLVATAYACRLAGLKSRGIVRGEQPAVVSPTLHDCVAYGMELGYISRADFSRQAIKPFRSEDCRWPGYLCVPEGGYHPLGAAGASAIMVHAGAGFTHICCAVGTATTLAGLLLAAGDEQTIVGIPVLKNLHDLSQRISYLTKRSFTSRQLTIIDQYHFGGYARKTAALINFMNGFYLQHQVPTDFVYTGKMMYAVVNSIQEGLFPAGSKILCIHTGGLQGNRSLPSGCLVFN
jgi:1-aminocyclopropane-1-carboxylate deaminase